MGDILDKIGEYMNKKVKYGIAGACLMLIIFIVYMICTYNPDRYYKSYEEENYAIVMEIIRCFDERDSAALDKMFSNNVHRYSQRLQYITVNRLPVRNFLIRVCMKATQVMAGICIKVLVQI